MAWPGSARIRPPKGTRRDLWAGWAPNGIGRQKPNHFLDMARVTWRNRRNLPYAWRLLRRGVCDGCALGVAGLHDWTMDGIHLCTTRLRLLVKNLIAEFFVKVLGNGREIVDEIKRIAYFVGNACG